MTIKNIRVIHDMPFAHYAELGAMNISKLVIAKERSWAALRHALQSKDKPDSGAMAVGRAFHAMVLEPESAKEQVLQFDAGRRSAKFAEFAEVNHDATVLTTDEYESARLMAQSILDNETIEPFLVGGNPEVVFTWMDDTTPCKARIDYYNCNILDLKSTRDLKRFGNEAAKLNYLIKLGWYARIIKSYTGETPDVIIAAVSNTSPYESRRFHLSIEQIQWGMREADDLIEEYKAIIDSGKWPELEPCELELPAWYGFENDIDDTGVMEVDSL